MDLTFFALAWGSRRTIGSVRRLMLGFFWADLATDLN
jgi:hypothetical protein